ncbi:MAG: glycosyltransferase [Actinobacteria bacterium]|nr:glycosyltransferase [Actinomycetota bacterium]
MRVLHVFKDYFPPTRGGIEQHINDVVHSNMDVKFAVLTSCRSRKPMVDDDDGVTVIRTPEIVRLASTPVTPSWRKFLAKSGADVIHFHSPNPFGELAFLASRTKIPMVLTYHSDIERNPFLYRFFAPFQRRFLTKADRIIVSSPNLRDSSIALRGHLERIAVIPFGVDPDLWAPRPPMVDDIRSRFSPPLIVFLGRLVPYKGVDVLIRAMRGIDARALIVGSGPMRQSLEFLAADLGVDKRVTFIGDVPDELRPAFYHSADVFVLPAYSRAETFGIAMLEAMACGTPVISTELGTGTSWVNQNKRTGLIVEAGSVSALAGAIRVMLSNEEMRKRMGEFAALRVRDHFTKQEMIKALEAVYLDTGGRGGH